MGHNNKLFETLLLESEISAKKFENTRAFIMSNGIKIYGTPNSDDWDEQIYAISVTAGNTPETLNDFFEKFDFNLLISLEYFMSFDEATINGEKTVTWQNERYEITFEGDNISRSSKRDNLKIRDKADHILNRLEYETYL